MCVSVRADPHLRPRRAVWALAISRPSVLPSVSGTTSAPRMRALSRLNGWPMRSRVNASLMPSRAAAHDSGSMRLSGRGADYSTPPRQIPACSFPAPGSRRKSNAIVGLDATDPQARSLCTLRRGRRLPQRNTRYRAGATPFPGPDFHRLDRASFAWRTAIPSS
jgi:hypothetical protein